MARYNHFTAKLKNERIRFGFLPIGAVFSQKDVPFKKCIKTGILEYKTADGNVGYYYNDSASVFIKKTPAP